MSERRQRRAETSYLFQLREDGHDDAGPVAGTYRWRDVATLTVPAGTKRRTVIERAVEENGQYELANNPEAARLIPSEYAEIVPVEWEVPPPRLKIG
jgi:hypothetical protein